MPSSSPPVPSRWVSLSPSCIGLWMLLAPGCGGPPYNRSRAPPEAQSLDPLTETTTITTTTFDPVAAFDEFEHTMRATYAYLDRLDIDATLARARVVALDTRDPDSFRAVLNTSLVVFCDPHLGIRPLRDTDLNVWPTSGDLVLGLVGDTFEVLDVRADSAADRAEIRPGQVVKQVGGEPLGRLVESLIGAFAASPTPRQRSYAATLLVNGRRTGQRQLTLHDDDGSRVVTLANPRTMAAEVLQLPPLSSRIQDGFAVIRINNALGRQETIAAFDAALAAKIDAPGLIIDLRNTPSGGNSDVARSIIGHFITSGAAYQVHRVPVVERRTTVPRHFVEYAEPRAPSYGGPVVVLGGRWTGSMGEGLLIGLDAAADAHTIASDMADLLGALYTEELKISGAVLELGQESLFHVDGTPREDFVADQPLDSADRDEQGGDPALNAALVWLREQVGQAPGLAQGQL